MDELAAAKESVEIKNQYVATENIREKIRAHSEKERAKTRKEAYDSDVLRFGLGEIQRHIDALENLTEKDVAGLASRIKRRKHATLEDLYRLSYAFLQSVENIRVFSKTQGALQVVIKEFTGSDAKRQISAAETLCNLSLGEAPMCEKIANLAGSYLVTYMECSEEKLKRTILWILANIFATSGKGALTMLQMKLIPNLWKLYTSDNDLESAEDAAICLKLIAANFRAQVSPEDVDYVKRMMHLKNPTSPGSEHHLQIVFNFDIVSPERVLEEQQVLYLMNFSLRNLLTEDIESSQNRMKILYGLRVLANLLAVNPSAYAVLHQQLSSVWHSNLPSIVNKLFAFNSDILSKEALWLLRNIVECEERSSNTIMLDSFLDKLQVPCVGAS